MKTSTLCATVLGTLILGGTVVSAAPNDPMTTTGHVTVKEGKIDPDDGIIDPEKPDEKLPDIPDVIPNPNKETGPLEISHAPRLQFGEIKTATKAVTTFAAPNKFTTKVDGKDVEQTRGPLIQFGDLRTDTNGYTVQAKMTQQFTQDKNELTGSTITFTNPYNATPKGSVGVAPKFEEKVELSYDKSALIATADKGTDKSGKGMWALEYGSSKNVKDEDTTGNSVQLLVPANTASSMAGGDYVANIEWSITKAP